MLQQVNLVLSCSKNSIIKIKTEHSVARQIINGMRNMHIELAVFATLPLENVEARRGGKAYVGVQKIELCESLVPFADELCLHIFKFFAQCRVVRALRVIHERNFSAFKFSRDWPEDVPVAFLVVIIHDSKVGFVEFGLLSASDNALDF